MRTAHHHDHIDFSATQRPPNFQNGYTTSDSVWRNRDKFFTGHEAIVAFLTDKWNIENGYRLRKELLSFTDNKIAIQFWYEYHETSGQWCRAYDLEDWTFADNGLMKKRQVSADDVKITQEERWFRDGVNVNSVDISERHW
ncbi:hypothetical protein CVT25_015688 [Psilocybe cyanescens]|uniref:DUF1348 domain-containing protein n=1 Tax=Psilocybe cyanescens TaxID=93625 RepID=A0A409XJM8_PSICY|nr:hypothetical protein CVT25_015688 [Psilocybe cyanescens]